MCPGLPCGSGATLAGPEPQTGERSRVEPSSDLSLSTAHAAPNRALSLGNPHSEGTVWGPRPRPGKGGGHLTPGGGGRGSQGWALQEASVRGAGSRAQDKKLCQGLGAEEGSLSSFRSAWCWTVPGRTGGGEQAGMALAAHALPSWGCGADAPTPLQP